MPVAGFEGPLASPPEKQGNRPSQEKLLLHLVSRTALLLCEARANSSLNITSTRQLSSTHRGGDEVFLTTSDDGLMVDQTKGKIIVES